MMGRDCVTVLYRMSESKKDWRCNGEPDGAPDSYFSMHVNLRRIFLLLEYKIKTLRAVSCCVEDKTTDIIASGVVYGM